MNSIYMRSQVVYRSILFCALMLFSTLVLAQDPNASGQPWYNQVTPESLATLNAQNMLVNIGQQIPNLMRMITAIAYVMGMYFIIHGVVQLKHVGEQRSYMSQEHSLKGPIIFLVVGAALIYLPTTVHVGLSTFWTDPAPYGYRVGEKDQWSEFLNVCFLIIQFVGTLAFIRGLVIMTQLGSHAQPNTFSRGLTHIIGGIFCINIYQFVQVILVTIGVQT